VGDLGSIVRAVKFRALDVIASRTAGAGRIWGARAGRLIVSAPFVAGRVRSTVARRITQFTLAVGAASFLSGLLSHFARADDDLRRLAHATATRVGDLDLAATIAAAPGSDHWQSPENQTTLLVARLLAAGDPAGALVAVGVGDGGSSPGTGLEKPFVDALRAVGQPQRLLSALDVSDIGATATIIAAFDAHWQLGDAEAALDTVADLGGGQLQNLELTRRLRDAIVATGGTADQAYDRVLEIASRSPLRSDVDWQLTLDFAFNRCDELLAKAALPNVQRRLQPPGRFIVAATQYVRRDFSDALTSISGLQGTRSHWAAQKLADRIELEEGRFAEASTIASNGAASSPRSTRSPISPDCISVCDERRSGPTCCPTTRTASARRSGRAQSSSPRNPAAAASSSRRTAPPTSSPSRPPTDSCANEATTSQPPAIPDSPHCCDGRSPPSSSSPRHDNPAVRGWVSSPTTNPSVPWATCTTCSAPRRWAMPEPPTVCSSADR